MDETNATKEDDEMKLKKLEADVLAKGRELEVWKRRSRKFDDGKSKKRASSWLNKTEQPKTKGLKKSEAQISDDDHEWAMFYED